MFISNKRGISPQVAQWKTNLSLSIGREMIEKGNSYITLKPLIPSYLSIIGFRPLSFMLKLLIIIKLQKRRNEKYEFSRERSSRNNY